MDQPISQNQVINDVSSNDNRIDTQQAEDSKFKAIDYKNKISGKFDKYLDESKHGDIKSNAESVKSVNKEDNSDPTFDKSPLKDWSFYLAYLTGFFLSVFAISFYLIFSKNSYHQKACIYGASASLFLLNVFGLYFLTLIIHRANSILNAPEPTPAGHESNLSRMLADNMIQNTKQIIQDTGLMLMKNIM